MQTTYRALRMDRSTERDLARFGETFAFLGIEVRRNRLFDGQGPSGRIHVTHPWALLIFDRWREEYMADQVQLVVSVDASVNDLWEWINDAAGIWPVEPLGFAGSRASLPLPAPQPTAVPSGAISGQRARRPGEREERVCWNHSGDHFGDKVPQVLIRSRPNYQLWSCDRCSFWMPAKRF